MKKLIMVTPFIRGEKLHLFLWDDEYRVYWNYGKRMATCYIKTHTLEDAKKEMENMVRKAKGA